MTATNPMLFFQVSATVIPTLLVASAISLPGFKATEAEDSLFNAFSDSFAVLLLLGAEGLALRAIATGRPSSSSRFDISLALFIALLAIAGELAGPRLVAFAQLWRKYRAGSSSRRRSASAWTLLGASVVMLSVPLVLIASFVFV
jgi:hypothetical protein